MADPTIPLTSAAERLQHARRKAGYTTAADAARAYGWNVVTYQSHESGTRGLKPSIAQRYGAAFRVSDAWLLTGKGDRTATGRTVKVVGYVGAGAELFAFTENEAWDGLDEVEAPAGTSPDAVCVIVRGTSGLPFYEDGDALIYSERREDVQDFLFRAKPLIVGLADGRRLLKQLVSSSKPGLFTLLSTNDEPIRDVEVEWVARIDWVKPRR